MGWSVLLEGLLVASCFFVRFCKSFVPLISLRHDTSRNFKPNTSRKEKLVKATALTSPFVCFYFATQNNTSNYLIVVKSGKLDSLTLHYQVHVTWYLVLQ